MSLKAFIEEFQIGQLDNQKIKKYLGLIIYWNVFSGSRFLLR